MNKKWLLMVFLLIASVSLATWPEAKRMEVRPGSTLGWDNASSTWRPFAVDPDTGAMEVNTGISSITVDAFPVYADSTGDPATATVDNSNRAVVNIGSETIGLVSSINLTTAELSNAHASATGNATTTMAVMPYLTDNSGFQRWFTAIVLGDNVNGNNTAVVAPWLFDGANWYRARSVASSGVHLTAEVSSVPIINNYTASSTGSLTPVTKQSYIIIQNNNATDINVWVDVDGSAAANDGICIRQGSSITRNWGADVTVTWYASETVSIAVEQGVLP